MSNYTEKEQLARLEKTLRSIAYNSSWFFLEPQQQDLKDDIRNLFNQPVAEIEPDIERTSPPPAAEGKPLPSPEVLNREPAQKTDYQADSSSPAEPVSLDPSEAQSLDSLHLRIRDCDRCGLCFNRKTVVFGQGNIHADLVFVGEGPGEEEDNTGLAFVGKAGKLLTQIIHAIGLNRESVYICNVVKCRPPGNRNPAPEEIAACSPILLKQIELIHPKLVVTLGNVATKCLVKDAVGIMKMRGKTVDFNGIPLIPTFHPSYLLRNPSALSQVWSDMRKIRQVLFQKPVISS
jgi:uracil-DNA glycosylase